MNLASLNPKNLRFRGRLISDQIDPFQPADGPPPRTLFAFFRWSVKGAWPVITFAAILSAIVGTLEVLTALILGWAVDAASTAEPSGSLFQHGSLILFLVFYFLVLAPIIRGSGAFANAFMVSPNISPLVLSRLHRWSMGQSVTFFDDDFAGRIAQKQMQTARAVTDVITELINVGAFAVASLIGSALLLSAIDLRMAAVLVVWLIAYVSLIGWFMPRIRALSGKRAGSRAMVTGQVVDTITNIKTVKLFGHADHEDRAALDAMRTFRGTALEFGELSAWFRVALVTLGGSLPVLLIGLSLMLWSIEQASAGDVAAAGALSIRLAQMTGWVSFALMAIYSNVGEVEDGIKTLTPPYTLTDTDDAKEIEITQGEVRFDNVSFAYGRDIGGVDSISLTVKPGEKLGIVGASGAGKSTLVSLALRLYDPEQGHIVIDNQRIDAVTQDSLRRQIGMVTQETAMFNRSAYDNILYGRPDASRADVISAAKRAEADAFIQDLQDFKGRQGYDAFLGERGVKLSGGQRQRIALARAILKDAPILVLDEATSALDSEVEAAIQQALTKVMDGKTVLAIAHRLSTIAQMDRIIVLEAGRIVEDGTHQQLLSAGGLYAQYWERQSGGFIGIAEAAE
jgi:ATP-binding cassette subfamily B protein